MNRRAFPGSLTVVSELSTLVDQSAAETNNEMIIAFTSAVTNPNANE